MYQANKNQQGQIIIEPLIAISIVSATLLAILTLTIFALRISGINVRRTKAHNLAQEAFEALRSIRDGDGTIQIREGGEVRQEQWQWNKIPALQKKHFRIASQNPWVVEDLSQATSPNYTVEDLLDSTNPLYKISYNTATLRWDPTEEDDPNVEYYYRQIELSDYDSDGDGPNVPDPEEKEVYVKVTFFERGNKHEVSYRTVLTNWQWFR